MPNLVVKCEIGLPLAGVKTNKLIAKQVHARGFVLIYTCTYITVILVTTSQFIQLFLDVKG